MQLLRILSSATSKYRINIVVENPFEGVTIIEPELAGFLNKIKISEYQDKQRIQFERSDSNLSEGNIIREFDGSTIKWKAIIEKDEEDEDNITAKPDEGEFTVGSGKTIKISKLDTSTPDPNDETELKEITGINTSYKAISKFSLNSSDTALDNNINKD